MKSIYTLLFLYLCAIFSATAQYSLPYGFATYSKGDKDQRTLYRVELHPGDTFEQIRATERKICEKGEIGGDIEGQISFDGKWLAFARCIQETEIGGIGENDYHDFDKWDIYIVRIDGDLPTSPIRIDHGYFPSWGNDSDQKTKTLYFSQEKGRCIKQVKINDKGEIIDSSILGTLPEKGYESFVFAAPDGTFAAFRKNGAVYTHFFSGPLAGKDIRMTDGCHPHITADSKWVYHAVRNAVRNDGSVRGNPGAGGDYHYGSSPDMHWFITKKTGDYRVQNNGGEVWVCPLYATDDKFETVPLVKICDDGSWVDIHTYDNRKNRKIAASNAKLLKPATDKTKPGKIKKVSAKQKAAYPVNADGAIFIWNNNLDNNQIISASKEFIRSGAVVPTGFSYIGLKGSMELKNGAFTVPDDDVNRICTDIARKENQFAFELEFRADNPQAAGPARIISFSNGTGSRNWTLGQEKEQLILRLRTTNTGENGTSPEIKLGTITPGQPYHIIVSYQPGILVWSLNGEISQTAEITGDLTNWSYDNKLIFGDEWGGERKWTGNIRNVTLYGWALPDKQIKKRAAEALKRLNELKSPDTIELKARLVKSSTIPPANQVLEQGYRRCIVSREYETLQPADDIPARIIVKEWVLMDGKTINPKQEGELYTLRLVPEESYPELRSEYTSDDLPLSDFPVFYHIDM